MKKIVRHILYCVPVKFRSVVNYPLVRATWLGYRESYALELGVPDIGSIEEGKEIQQTEPGDQS